MSTITDALEAEVAAIRAIRAKAARCALTPREAAAIDRHYGRLMALIAPRVRHFTRAYGLLDMADDAQQACAIGLHRALETYDPAKARFTTFVNWQLRGELQALRFRMRLDSREPARQVRARTISLDALVAESDPGTVLCFEDAEAWERTEAMAAESMARRACGRLLDEHDAAMRRLALRQAERRKAPRGPEAVKPGTIAPHEIDRIEARIAQERGIAMAHLTGDDDAVFDDGLTGEQRRQITRRTLRALSDRARGNPRFDPEAFGLDLPSSRRH